MAESLLGGERMVDTAQARNEALHDVSAAHCVGEPGVLGAREGERRDPELTDSPEALHLAGREQPDDGLILGFVEGDESVDGVTKNHVAASAGIGAGRSWVVRKVQASATAPLTR